MNQDQFFFFFFCGMEYKKWMSFLRWLFILCRNGTSRISISLMLVGHHEPATIGLKLRSHGFEISMYSDFCVVTAISYFFRLMNFQ